MVAIVTDRRRIETQPDLGAHERARDLARRLVEIEVALARELLRVAQTRTFVALDCASVEEYGVRLGLSLRLTRQLVEAGRALDRPATGLPDDARDAQGRRPATVADAVVAGVASLTQATLAGRLLHRPELLRDGEDPVRIALTQPVRCVQALIRAREEEAAQQQTVCPLALAVTDRARRGFARARAVASERAGAVLTEGETFALVVEHYLDSFDPLRQGEGRRRVPDTATLAAERYVPAEVRRAVRARSREHCEVPGCPHDVFLEFAHIDPHRDGGSREATNLLRLCHGHHVLLDAGRLRFAGWEDGLPTFRDSAGRVIRNRAGPAADAPGCDAPDAGSVAERPPPAWARDRAPSAVTGSRPSRSARRRARAPHRSARGRGDSDVAGTRIDPGGGARI